MKPESSLADKLSDQKLGMDQAISRRDLLHGIGTLTAAAMLPSSGIISEVMASADKGSPPVTDRYPPALTGIRGDHPGSFEVSHQLAREGKRDWGPVHEPDTGLYDLVVVGAGLSGLSAARFYQQQHPQARILILDNHDDFGGHAIRNEFKAGDRTLVGYGGTQSMEEPSGYSDIVRALLDDLGIEPGRFDHAYDQGFYQRNGLRSGIHFNQDAWGIDKVVPYDLGILEYLPLAPTSLSAEQAVAEMPISAAARVEILRLLLMREDQIPEVPANAKEDYLYRISYREFLSKHLDISEPEVFAIFQDLASDFGVGIEAVPAANALGYSSLPGWDAAGLPDEEPGEKYIHHFPDGNASIARLLVRKLIPAVAAGNSMEDVVTARFNYSKLDQANSPVRLRLDSTVTRVKHDQSPETAKRVLVDYVYKGQAFRVQSRTCILACNNSIIPYLCPELPKPQREALAWQVKTPILYTSVALRNWRAWKKLGIGAVVAPGSYHVNAMLDFPVSLGEYTYSASADEPVIVHMERFPHRSNEGLSAREQNRLGRYELLSTPFETIERNVRGQLASMLAEGGFDPARDITGITVNRWAHGYASSYNPLFDTVYEEYNDERYPHMRARKRFGRIAIANADAAANAMFEAAVEQAHRAVTELT